ncbi:MAG: hypothetical protein A2Y15_00640 [Clostridiales bacterium GWF2_36_10]|nr:MAG: hypothetical protein A2Y15_00640 [Clostridiales bacterium GWF2_36_10]HAN21525.1 hypothetical protein [Clostridiales bacterium]
MKKQILKQFAMTLLSLVLIGYLVLQLALNVGDILEMENVTYTTAIEKTEMTAYIFRDEYLVPKTATGTNSYLVDDGEKVSKGEQIALTYSDSSEANLQDRIKDINKKITVLEKSGINTGSSTTDIKKLDENIDIIMLEIIRAIDENDLEKALRFKNELIIESNRKQSIVSDKLNYETQINSLKSEKATLEASLSGNRVIHASQKAGYFYSSIDGYENNFTIDNLNNLTIDKFDTLSGSIPDQNLINNSVGKLIISADWYMVCETDKRTASNYKDGYLYNFAFPFSSGIQIEMKLARKISQTDLDRVLLIYTSNAMPDGFNYTRVQKVEQIKNTYAGLKISVSALRINNGETGVFALDGNKIIFKKATILYEENGYYICKLPIDPNYPLRKNKAYVSRTDLSLYDAVIYSGRNLYVGKVLQ